MPEKKQRPFADFDFPFREEFHGNPDGEYRDLRNILGVAQYCKMTAQLGSADVRPGGPVESPASGVVLRYIAVDAVVAVVGVIDAATGRLVPAKFLPPEAGIDNHTVARLSGLFTSAYDADAAVSRFEAEGRICVCELVDPASDPFGGFAVYGCMPPPFPAGVQGPAYSIDASSARDLCRNESLDFGAMTPVGGKPGAGLALRTGAYLGRLAKDVYILRGRTAQGYDLAQYVAAYQGVIIRGSRL